MQKLLNLWSWLKGKKTYIVASVTIVYALSGAYLKYFPYDHAAELIFGALGLGALRNALN